MRKDFKNISPTLRRVYSYLLSSDPTRLVEFSVSKPCFCMNDWYFWTLWMDVFRFLSLVIVFAASFCDKMRRTTLLKLCNACQHTLHYHSLLTKYSSCFCARKTCYVYRSEHVVEQSGTYLTKDSHCAFPWIMYSVGYFYWHFKRHSLK